MGAAQELTEWDDEAFEHALKQAGEGIIKAQGVRLSAQQLDLLLAAAPRHADDPRRARLEWADFSGATFTGDADFHGATFVASAGFFRTIFRDSARFSGVTFNGEAHFPEASFGGADFSGAAFSDSVEFLKATFNGYAVFAGATFSGRAHFGGARFIGYALFQGTTFIRDVDFGRATFCSDADFSNTNFKEATRFGPVSVLGELKLDRASIGRIEIEVSAARLSYHRTQFRDAANTFVRCADVVLDGATFERPSVVAWSPDLGFKDRERALVHHPSRPKDVPPDRFRVVSMRLANVETSRSPTLIYARVGSQGRVILSGFAPSVARLPRVPLGSGHGPNLGRFHGGGHGGRHWLRSSSGAPHTRAATERGGQAGTAPSANHHLGCSTTGGSSP